MSQITVKTIGVTYTFEDAPKWVQSEIWRITPEARHHRPWTRDHRLSSSGLKPIYSQPNTEPDRMSTIDKRRKMKQFVINEISAVDNPAAGGCKDDLDEISPI